MSGFEASLIGTERIEFHPLFRVLRANRSNFFDEKQDLVMPAKCSRLKLLRYTFTADGPAYFIAAIGPTFMTIETDSNKASSSLVLQV